MRTRMIALLLLILPLLAACGSEEPAPPPTAELSLTATDIAYDVTRFDVMAGQPVRLTLHNNGTLEHDFSIMAMPHTGEVVAGEMAGEMDDHDMSGMMEEPEIHVAAPIGGRNTLAFTPSTPGEYEFFCTVEGHKDAGMKGVLVVTAP